MQATPPRNLSAAAMLTSLAYLTLPHTELDTPGHSRPITLKLQTPGHVPSSSIRLLMGISE